METEKIYVPNPYRVLVVDDDEMWAQECMETLRNKGIEVDYASGANKAAEMLQKKRYHGGVFDKNMPDLDGKDSKRAGIDLFKYTHEKYPDMSCLLLTSESSLRTFMEAEDLGMFAYREKGEANPQSIAEMVFEMFQTRIVPVINLRRGGIQADRMYFYGKIGKVTKAVSKEVADEWAGAVEVEGEIWKATTKGMIMAVNINAGKEVRCYGISHGAIQVGTETY
jgi:ActR/RegA family two-component response regulator